MKCPVCGQSIQMKNSQTGECQNCGMEFSLDALKDLRLEQGLDVSASQSLDASSQQEKIDDASVSAPTQTGLKKNALAFQWETSIPFSVLGVICLLAMNVLPLFGIVGIACDLLFIAVDIVYVCVIYPSYFGEKPKLTSSKAISFCNLFFCGVIFGPLFNANLTKGEKGISYIVGIVFFSISLIAGFACSFLSLIPHWTR